MKANDWVDNDIQFVFLSISFCNDFLSTSPCILIGKIGTISNHVDKEINSWGILQYNK